MSWQARASRIEQRQGEPWAWVAVDEWHALHADLARDGMVRLEHLTAYDDGGVWLVSAVCDAAGSAMVRVVCGPVTAVRAIDDLYMSARWHQREVAQMFGVTFDGAQEASDAFEGAFDGHPLLRTHGLTQRTDRSWPGAFEPDESARRRPAPSPGVIAEWSS